MLKVAIRKGGRGQWAVDCQATAEAKGHGGLFDLEFSVKDHGCL